MLNQELRIQELTSLGLSLNEAKTYLALLIKNYMTINEIAQVSGVPRAKVYGVIKKLVKRGFCIEKAEDIKKCRAVDPQVVVEKLNEIYQQKVERRQIVAQRFSDSVASLYQQNINKTDPLEYIEIIKDKRQIRRRWFELQESAQNTIYSFSKHPYVVPLEENIDAENSVLRKDIRYRAIYEYKNNGPETEKEKFINMISNFTSAGEEARIIKELPMKLTIIDEKITMLSLNDPVSLKSSMTTMVITHTGFAQSQKHMFESYWEKAITFDDFKNKEEVK